MSEHYTPTYIRADGYPETNSASILGNSQKRISLLHKPQISTELAQCTHKIYRTGYWKDKSSYFSFLLTGTRFLPCKTLCQSKVLSMASSKMYWWFPIYWRGIVYLIITIHIWDSANLYVTVKTWHQQLFPIDLCVCVIKENLVATWSFPNMLSAMFRAITYQIFYLLCWRTCFYMIVW